MPYRRTPNFLTDGSYEKDIPNAKCPILLELVKSGLKIGCQEFDLLMDKRLSFFKCLNVMPWLWFTHGSVPIFLTDGRHEYDIPKATYPISLQTVKSFLQFFRWDAKSLIYSWKCALVSLKCDAMLMIHSWKSFLLSFRWKSWIWYTNCKVSLYLWALHMYFFIRASYIFIYLFTTQVSHP